MLKAFLVPRNAHRRGSTAFDTDQLRLVGQIALHLLSEGLKSHREASGNKVRQYLPHLHRRQSRLVGGVQQAAAYLFVYKIHHALRGSHLAFAAHLPSPLLYRRLKMQGRQGAVFLLFG